MPRKKSSPDLNQFSFNFAFDQTINTINRLQAAALNDKEPGTNHDNQPASATHNRSTNPQTVNNSSDPAVTLISSARMENHRPLGIQQPREITRSGNSGGTLATLTATGTTATGAEHTDQLHGANTTWADRAGHSEDQRDQHRIVKSVDYTITDADHLGAGGQKAKYRDNIAALELLLQLRKQKREANSEEQAILVRYVGWGGLPQVFDHRNQDWETEYHQLSALLSREEYDHARRSTQDAHYTSQTVINGIYKGLQRIGFSSGRLLEPASGIGNFIGLMPPAMRSNSHFTAIELDTLTSEIGRHLYPSSTQINRGLQDVMIPSGYFDVCVGNPPFGSQSLFDPQHRELNGFSIHNYFLSKSLDKLRDGGVMAVVVSRYFMDAVNTTVRV